METLKEMLEEGTTDGTVSLKRPARMKCWVAGRIGSDREGCLLC